MTLCNVETHLSTGKEQTSVDLELPMAIKGANDSTTLTVGPSLHQITNVYDKGVLKRGYVNPIPSHNVM